MPLLMELRGNCLEGKKKVHFSMSIAAPRKDRKGNYFCRLESPELIEEHLDIFGTTPTQAVRLAFDALRAILGSLLSPDSE